MTNFKLEIFRIYDQTSNYKWKLRDQQHGFVLREGSTETKWGAKSHGKRAKRLELKKQNDRSKPEIFDI